MLYKVTIGFAGYYGCEEEYEVDADTREEAEEFALKMARNDLDVMSVESEDGRMTKMNDIKLLSIMNYEINDKERNIGTLSIVFMYEKNKERDFMKFANIPYELYMDCGDVCVDFHSEEFEDILMDADMARKCEKQWERMLKELMNMYIY